MTRHPAAVSVRTKPQVGQFVTYRSAAAPGTPIAVTAWQRCQLCGAERAHGDLLVTEPGKPEMWVCDDCQRMLLRGVDDAATPGD